MSERADPVRRVHVSPEVERKSGRREGRFANSSGVRKPHATSASGAPAGRATPGTAEASDQQATDPQLRSERAGRVGHTLASFSVDGGSGPGASGVEPSASQVIQRQAVPVPASDPGPDPDKVASLQGEREARQKALATRLAAMRGRTAEASGRSSDRKERRELRRSARPESSTRQQERQAMRETRREAREERRASLEAKRDARAEASQKRQERQAQKDAERSARAEASKQRKEEEAKKPKTAEERGRAKVRSVRERGDGSLFKGAALTGKDMVRDQIAGKISDAKETVMGAVGRAQAKYKAVKDTVSGIHGAVSEIRGRTAPGGDGKKTVAGSDKPDKKLAAKATPAKAAAVDKPKEPATAKKSFHPPIGGCPAKEGLNRKKSAPTPGTAACS